MPPSGFLKGHALVFDGLARVGRYSQVNRHPFHSWNPIPERNDFGVLIPHFKSPPCSCPQAGFEQEGFRYCPTLCLSGHLRTIPALLMSMADLCVMMDEANPPKKRGPYKKAT